MTFVKGEIPEGAKPFKEGECGNPNGRPKGKSFKTVLEAMLDLECSDKDLEDEEIKEHFKGANYKPTNRDIVAVRMLLKAKQDGESKSAERLMNRVEGKPIETIKQNIEVAVPLVVNDNENDPAALPTTAANNLPDTEAKRSEPDTGK